MHKISEEVLFYVEYQFESMNFMLLYELDCDNFDLEVSEISERITMCGQASN